MVKNLKQIMVVLLVSVVMFVICGADSLGPINVGIVLGICYILWRVLKLNEIFQNINE